MAIDDYATILPHTDSLLKFTRTRPPPSPPVPAAPAHTTAAPVETSGGDDHGGRRRPGNRRDRLGPPDRTAPTCPAAAEAEEAAGRSCLRTKPRRLRHRPGYGHQTEPKRKEAQAPFYFIYVLLRPHNNKLIIFYNIGGIPRF